MLGSMLGDVSSRATVLAAQRQTLYEAQRHQQYRSKPADSLVCRQQTDCERSAAHTDNRDEEGVLAADDVADAAEHERAERSNKKSCSVCRKGGQQRSRVVTFRKKQRCKERRQRRIQVKIVPLEHRT